MLVTHMKKQLVCLILLGVFVGGTVNGVFSRVVPAETTSVQTDHQALQAAALRRL